MKNEVAASAAAPDPGYRRKPQRSRLQTERDDGKTAPEADGADLRLIIQEDPGSDACTYIIVDRRTGEVVQRLSREEVLRLGEDDSYEAGGVIRTKA